MSDPFLGEIRPFAFNFPPRGWATCAGQLLPIAQNTALFSLLGTFYGGNGSTNFALPNLRDRSPLQQGQGRGLSLRSLGEPGGVPTVTLLLSQIPAHPHTWRPSVESADLKIPSPVRSFASASGNVYQSAAPDKSMAPNAIGITGSSSPHNNLQPYLAVNFCIALEGIYPKRP